MYKRGAAIYGDIRFQSGRRLLMRYVVAQNRTAYNYQFSERGNSSPQQGVPHGADLSELMSPSTNAAGATLAKQFISFATKQSPNSDGLPDWPTYGTDKHMLSLRSGSVSLITDTYRDAAMKVLLTPDARTATGK
jgi:carboxylesterase type B